LERPGRLQLRKDLLRDEGVGVDKVGLLEG